MTSHIIIDVLNSTIAIILAVLLIFFTVVAMTVFTRSKVIFRLKDIFAVEVDAEQK